MVFNLDISVIIVIIIVGIIFGLIGAGVYFLIKVFIADWKSKRQWKNNQGIFKIKKNPKEVVSEESPQETPKPMTQELPQEKPLIPNILNVFKKKNEPDSYKDDFKKFNEANKELERLKKGYEKGELTYNELKEKFEFYQNQDYYKRIVEGGNYGKEN